jgi:hypothetical protein
MRLYRGDRVGHGADVIRHVLLRGLLARCGDGGDSALLCGGQEVSSSTSSRTSATRTGRRRRSGR